MPPSYFVLVPYPLDDDEILLAPGLNDYGGTAGAQAYLRTVACFDGDSTAVRFGGNRLVQKDRCCTFDSDHSYLRDKILDQVGGNTLEVKVDMGHVQSILPGRRCCCIRSNEKMFASSDQ